ncbi:hypothetical protein E6O75_ATG02246 [Venturia nashicola]|uniref:N-alpha-acetyltransferase 40 n=1 Tax=Venturia nashicola TaxID=86259 RepID=A0A4Z1PL24_9PEZI|nr:hypothetical protein E6O75_ATG02246 [Venturia nashicola]
MNPNPSECTTTLNSPSKPLNASAKAAINLLHANSLPSSQFIKEYVPTPSRTFTAKDGVLYTCTFKRTQDLTPEEKEACFQLIKQTSKRDYEVNAEAGWDDERKRKEMGEAGMRFVLVRKASNARMGEGGEEGRRQDTPLISPSSDTEEGGKGRDDTILGFTSFSLEIDHDTHIPQLYLYEIHLLPPARSLGLGRHLMSLNEILARSLELEKVMLTVFTCNSKAEGMYRRLGYVMDEESPKERVLRSGKIVRPKYLIMSKAIS